MFQIDSYAANTNTIGWHVGGFQGGRGSNSGSQWFVENIFEELDAPNEYFYDASTAKLYFCLNGTGAPPASSTFVATFLKTLFSIQGSQSAPVKNLKFQGLKFQNSAYTYMDAHGVPSGGDWGLQRSGALFFEGTEGLVIENSLFTRLDGIAVFLSGYNRNATIQNNEFVWIGDSAMAAWGYTKDIDGTGGDFPRYSRILGNFVHEFGHFTKQSSAWIQARTAQSFFQGNIIFNGPRAGININDGFGGGNELVNNLIFNQVRETSDHGTFNSWDRQPFLTTVADGTPSLNPQYSLIHHNMFIGNYGSEATIDNDDGSTFYKNYNNFEVYGCHKDYFAGHNKFTYQSVLVFPKCWGRSCGFYTDFTPGYVDGYWNNTCVQQDTKPYMTMDNFNPNAVAILHDNKIYNSAGTVTVQIGNTLLTEAQWQAKGQDPGTKGYPMPSDDQIIAWGRAAMGF